MVSRDPQEDQVIDAGIKLPCVCYGHDVVPGS